MARAKQLFAKRSRDELIFDDLKQAMETPSGRRLMYYITHELCGVMNVVFDLKIKDGVCASMENSRLEGMRQAGLTLLTNLQRADTAAYNAMILEGLQERQAAALKEANKPSIVGDEQ